MTTTRVTSKNLDDALIRDAIPAIGWHILSLKLGFNDHDKSFSNAAIAKHYKVDADLVSDIADAALRVVQRSQ